MSQVFWQSDSGYRIIGIDEIVILTFEILYGEGERTLGLTLVLFIGRIRDTVLVTRMSLPLIEPVPL